MQPKLKYAIIEIQKKSFAMSIFTIKYLSLINIMSLTDHTNSCGINFCCFTTCLDVENQPCCGQPSKPMSCPYSCMPPPPPPPQSGAQYCDVTS